MIRQLPKNFLDVIQQNDGLQRYLSSLSIGREFTPRSWLYEDEEPDTILENWMHHLSRLEHGDSFDRNVYQFDTSQLEKWGPQGGIAPIQDLMEEIVLPTFKKHSPASAFDSLSWSQAQTSALRNFAKMRVHDLRPASYKHVLDDMRARDTLESNSGWPLFTRRNKPDVKAQAVAAAEDGEWLEYPAIALFRNYNKKTRLVWMFPMSTNLEEGSFFQPLQSSIVKANDPFYSPWVGFEKVRDLITQCYDAGGYLYASDFSATDEHFRMRATMETYEVIQLLFKSSFRYDLGRSLRRMHTIPLIVGENTMITGDHGVSSGSNWTNFIETVFDQIFAYYVSIHIPRVHGLYAIGDDMAWYSSEFDDAFSAKLAELGRRAGQEINPGKVTNYPDKVKTLQRLFQRGYRRPDGKLRGVYSTIRALKSSVYPEKFHKPKLWSSDMFCARQYMILENCVDHPLFEEFVKFVVQGQKDLIPFAQKSRAELDRILRETKLLPGFNPTYNQERRDQSLANFSSIRIARSC